LSDEGQRNMVRNTPKWEAELWSYLRRSDSLHCPLHDDCDIRRKCEWCLDDHKEELEILCSGAPLSVDLDAERLDIFREVTNPNILENWASGRIFQLVAKLANKYIEKSNLTQPPVPAQIIDNFDIEHPVEIRFVSLKAYQGAVWHIDNSWIVHISSQEPLERQRITLFHEIFHIIAHANSTPVFRKRGRGEGYFNELLADYFAICILLPQNWIAEKWAEVNDLKRMTEIFQVTELTMRFRLKTMRLL